MTGRAIEPSCQKVHRVGCIAQKGRGRGLLASAAGRCVHHPFAHRRCMPGPTAPMRIAAAAQQFSHGEGLPACGGFQQNDADRRFARAHRRRWPARQRGPGPQECGMRFAVASSDAIACALQKLQRPAAEPVGAFPAARRCGCGVRGFTAAQGRVGPARRCAANQCHSCRKGRKSCRAT